MPSIALRTSRWLSLLSIAAMSGQTWACATTITVSRMKPAEINLAGYTRVAVGDLRGPGGQELVAEVTAALFASKRFEVLDRQHLSNIVKEQDLGASGAISEETAATIGQLIGSAALLVGEVSEYSYNESQDQQESTCRESYKDKDGKTQHKDVPCITYWRRAKARVAATFQVIDTTTGRVLASKNMTAKRQQDVSRVNEWPPPINAGGPWLAACRKQVVSRFMKVIAPYQVTVKVKLLDDGDLPDLEIGNNFATIGNWAKAIESYRRALGAAKMNPKIKPGEVAKVHYNLGVGLGYSGQYDEGIGALETSYGLDPDADTKVQIDKLREFKSDDARLKEQEAGAVDAGMS